MTICLSALIDANMYGIQHCAWHFLRYPVIYSPSNLQGEIVFTPTSCPGCQSQRMAYPEFKSKSHFLRPQPHCIPKVVPHLGS